MLRRHRDAFRRNEQRKNGVFSRTVTLSFLDQYHHYSLLQRDFTLKLFSFRFCTV